jgi:nitroimidazol reductase NimA-like FMN-containing flavoprotein (pyridoxamine 5'-phosphate oxidase superfamily)
MPGYGLLGPAEGRGLLDWSWAEDRLRSNRNYWLSTVTETGRPHAVPVWGVWELDSFFFSTGAATRKARNLAQNPRCVVTTEGAAEAVIVEGRAELVVDADVREFVPQRYEAKYSTGYPPDSHLYRVRPDVAFGFIERASEFAGAATRWQFTW